MFGFFKHANKSLPSIPESLPPKAGRVRFTTEEYMNSLYQPEVTQSQPGIRIAEWNQTFSPTSMAHLVQQQVNTDEGIKTVQHVFISGGVQR